MMRRARAAATRFSGAIARPAAWLAMACALAAAAGCSGRQAAPPDPYADLPVAALADSQRAADTRRDWASALAWAERRATREPRSSTAILDLARALHNLGWHVPQRDLVHSGVPYSLARAEIDQRVLALADSAARLARDPDDWARARTLTGLSYEVLGYPLDALGVYLDVRIHAPKFPDVIPRGEWVFRLLRDPHARPDTLRGSPEAAGPAPPPWHASRGSPVTARTRRSPGSGAAR